MEVEFKFAVHGEQAFDQLLAVLELGKRSDFVSVLQVNHFFDTGQRTLRRAGFALRLREEGEVWWLTAKGRETRPSGNRALTERLEAEVEIDAASARSLLEGERSAVTELEQRLPAEERNVAELLRATIGAEALLYVGCFHNTRTRVEGFELPLEGRVLPLLFELDTTTYPGDRQAFEIEVEIDATEDAEAVRKALDSILAEARIEWWPAPSKAKRFFALLDSSPAGGGGLEASTGPA